MGNHTFYKSIQARQTANPSGGQGRTRGGEEESKEKPKGVGTGGLLKGARGYVQWRSDLHQASEMTASDLL